MKKTFALFLTLLLGVTTIPAATYIWSGAGNNKLMSNPANWSSGGVPSPTDNHVILIFPTNGTAEAVMNIPNLKVATIEIYRHSFTLSGTNNLALTIRQYFAADQAIQIYGVDQVTFAATLPLVLETSCHVHASTWYHFQGWDGQWGAIEDYVDVRFLGPISGAGGLNLTGTGCYVLGGTAPNTYAGKTSVQARSLQLAKTAGVVAVPTDLWAKAYIEYGSGTPRGTIQTLSPGQIAAGANVRGEQVEFLIDHAQLQLGQLWLYSSDFKVATGTVNTKSLRLSGSFQTVDFGPTGGQLAGDVLVESGNTTHLRGKLTLVKPALGRPEITVNLNAGAQLEVFGNLNGPGDVSLRWKGAGVLYLNSAHTYAGLTFLDVHNAFIRNAGAFGAAEAETVIGEAAAVYFDFNGILPEPLTFVGDTAPPAAPTNDARWTLFDSVTCTGTIHLTNYVHVKVPTNHTMTLTSEINGPGQLIKSGTGLIRFSGTRVNTFTGGFYLRQGEAESDRVKGGLAFPGPLLVGDGQQNPGDPEILRCLMPNQIGDAATVIVKHPATLLFAPDAHDTIGNLELHGATVEAAQAIVQLTGDIHTYAAAQTAFFHGALALSPGTHTIHVANGAAQPDFVIVATISGGATGHLTKTGPGALSFWGANSYGGNTHINAGLLSIAHHHGLGAPTGATVVASNAVLEIMTIHPIGGQALTLAAGTLRCNFANTNTWGGPISVSGQAVIETLFASTRLVLTNVITGPGGFTKRGPGGLELAGAAPNSFAGDVFVEQGELRLNKSSGPAISGGAFTIGLSPRNGIVPVATVNSLQPAQVSEITAVYLSSYGVWNLNHHADTIGSLAGFGSLNLGTAALTFGGLNTDTAFAGPISGSGTTALNKLGTGQFVLSGPQTYSGRTWAYAGNLFAECQNTNSTFMVAAPAILGGSGSIGAISGSGGVINPGTGPGQLKTRNLIWGPNHTFHCDLAGSVPGVGHDQIKVTGTVTLGSAKLHLALDTSGAVGTEYVLIDNDGADAVLGTFQNLPEGTTFSCGGIQFRISYAGGTGNDVVLTQLTLPTPPTIQGIAKLPDGAMQITGSGFPHATYAVEANANLASTNWVNLGPVSAGAQGEIHFVDTDAPNHSQRFYRFKTE